MSFWVAAPITQFIESDPVINYSMVGDIVKSETTVTHWSCKLCQAPILAEHAKLQDALDPALKHLEDYHEGAYQVGRPILV